VVCIEEYSDVDYPLIIGQALCQPTGIKENQWIAGLADLQAKANCKKNRHPGITN
jgi:hypothetical protein